MTLVYISIHKVNIIAVYYNIYYLPFCLDNAYDPDVNAKELWIDKRVINGVETLSFLDNGNGMREEKLHKMLRL